jgi:predicted Fe-S protein YdhL (DUF1289 family)
VTRGARERLVERAVRARAMARDLPSPCVSICRMDPASGFCEGCLRTLDEIGAWSRIDDAEKHRIWRAVGLRAGAGFLQPDEEQAQP